MPKKAQDPFALKLSDEQWGHLARWVTSELQAAIDARASAEGEVERWWQLYEQARTRSSSPWPDAADLTSYLPAEKVDAIAARGMKTVWVDPIWSVEAWGDAASRAPFVEEFHQWKAEEERLQSVLDRLWIISQVEPRGLLEVYEGTETRVTRKRINAALEMDPMSGGPVYGEDGNAKLQMQDGNFVEAQGDMPAQAVTVIDSPEPVRTGPCYRIIPYRDSVLFPGHARDQQDIWGYGKRLWKRMPDIQRQAMGPNALYNKAQVEKLPNTGDKEPDAALTRAGQAVAPQQDVTAEKELWELTLLLDLEALFTQVDLTPVKPELRGNRWYVLTVHKDQNLMLRVQHDDMDTRRYLPLILFPRPDRATEGYSAVGHKMITMAEEHSAWRNMLADRGKLLLQLPIKRQTGALWDPYEQPFGPNAVIDVRDMREVEPFQMPETGMADGFNHVQMLERNCERVMGVNDIASGNVATGDKTLGEIQMATEQSFVRMDMIIRRFQEFMEDLFQVRHVIWKRCLAEQQDGLDAPQSLLDGLEGRGVSIDQTLGPDKKITAQLLEGAFRGRPRGSVETADKNRQRMDWMNFLKVLPELLQMFGPILGPAIMNPKAVREIFRQTLFLFNIKNTQAFLGSLAQDFQQQQQLDQMPGAPALPPPPPMMGPPGAPPGPGGPPPPGGPQGPPQGGATNPLSAMAAHLAQTMGPPPAHLVGGAQ